MGGVASALLYAPLHLKWIRRRVVFWLKQHYYSDIELVVPLNRSLVCPVYFEEALCSFSEIFLQGEYRDILEQVDLPSRWLDIGCHAGYFSLYLEWLRRERGMNSDAKALLIDADSRVQHVVERLISLNELQNCFSFRRALISDIDGDKQFIERAFMSSSLEGASLGNGKPCKVKTISAEEIGRLFPPPYDLIKLDIEGGEYDFLCSYQSVLRQTKYLILEWHAWHGGGGGKPQIIQLAKKAGFEQTDRDSSDSGLEETRQGGVLLLRNTHPD